MPTYADNRKAAFDYEVLEKFEAGLVLTGMEVKSIRTGHISLKGAFITFHGNEPMLTNAHIAKYKYAGKSLDYEPEKGRKILLKKREINQIRGKMQEKGLTIVPLSVYTKGRHIKIEIAVCRGKKKYDKRASIKEREMKVELRRKIKGEE